MAAVTSCENTLYRIALAQARKPYWIKLLFSHKNGDFGAIISITERSCAAPMYKVKRHLSDRFCARLWCSVNRYSDSGGSDLVGVRTGDHEDGSKCSRVNTGI